MTPYQEWLTIQSVDFKHGFDAYHKGLSDDISESPDWHAGYDEARKRDNEENQRYI